MAPLVSAVIFAIIGYFLCSGHPLEWAVALICGMLGFILTLLYQLGDNQKVIAQLIHRKYG